MTFHHYAERSPIVTRRRTLALLLGGAALAGCTAVETANWQAMLESIGQDWAAVSGELGELGVDVEVAMEHWWLPDVFQWLMCVSSRLGRSLHTIG
jgi:hypothetical protein